MPYKVKISSIRKGISGLIIVFFRFSLRLSRIVVNLFVATLDQIFGTIPSLIRANRIISKKIRGKYNDEILSDDPRLKLPIEHLKDYLNSEIERLSKIEEKAKSNIVGVTIAIAIITGPSLLLPTRLDDIVNQPNSIKWLLVVALILAVAFFLFSGYFAYLAFSVGEISKPSLEDHISIKEKEQIQKIFIKSIELNSLRIIQKANLLSASMDCLRNGLGLFSFILVMSIIAIFR